MPDDDAKEKPTFFSTLPVGLFFSDFIIIISLYNASSTLFFPIRFKIHPACQSPDAYEEKAQLQRYQDQQMSSLSRDVPQHYRHPSTHFGRSPKHRCRRKGGARDGEDEERSRKSRERKAAGRESEKENGEKERQSGLQ